MKTITLINSKNVVLVDDRYFKYLSKHRWMQNQSGHAISSTRINGRHFLMQKLLKNGEIIHHVNGVRLDNRRTNLIPMSRGKHTILHRTGQKHSEETKNKLRRENNPAHKLTAHQVSEIRYKYIPRTYTMKRLAIEFGVFPACICRIINKQRW